MGTEPSVLVLFCRDTPGVMPSGYREWTGGASIYPAVQNLLLAARASGLGGWLTTLHLRYEAEVKALLGIPKGVDTYALVPLGYPRDKFGPLRRRPVREATYLDVWAPTCRARRCACNSVCLTASGAPAATRAKLRARESLGNGALVLRGEFHPKQRSHVAT